MTSHLHIAGFLGDDETASLLAGAEERAQLLRPVASPAGFGPRYRVIDGEQLQAHWPSLVAYGEGELRRAVEQLTGLRLRLMDSPKRAIHVQVYATRAEGFRWHFDGHTLAAMLTLRSGAGSTEIIPPALSRWLRLPLYALYPWPHLLSLLPAARVAAAPGDLVVLHGERVLHRGVMRGDGERWLLIFNYDEVGRRPSRWRDRWARRINY